MRTLLASRGLPCFVQHCTLSWHVWDYQTDICSHSTCIYFYNTAQRPRNSRKVLIWLVIGITILLIAVTSRHFYPEHLHFRYILSVGGFPAYWTQVELQAGYTRMIKNLSSSKTHCRRVLCLLTKTVWALLYFPIYAPTLNPTQESHTSVPACVTRSVSLPAQVSSVISISVVMATQQQGGKWQPNLWHSHRPGQAWGQGGKSSHELQGPAGSPGPQSNSFDLKEKREHSNTLLYSFRKINVSDLCINSDGPLFKTGRVKYWAWGLAYVSRSKYDDLQLAQ